jgi:hypothetical protein
MKYGGLSKSAISFPEMHGHPRSTLFTWQTFLLSDLTVPEPHLIFWQGSTRMLKFTRMFYFAGMSEVSKDRLAITPLKKVELFYLVVQPFLLIFLLILCLLTCELSVL